MRKIMTENQRLVWFLPMSVCASINETMQMFRGVSYEASDQHKDKSAARQARYVSDTIDLIDYLNERDPFIENGSLYLTLPMVWHHNKSYGWKICGIVNIPES